MLRLARAFLWLRTRLLINSFRKGQGRDAFERISRAAAAIAPFLLALLLVPTVLLMAAAGLIGGWTLETSTAPVVVLVCRGALLVATIMAFIAPLVRSFQGSMPNVTRLVLLPIPRRGLHLAEVLGGIADPWIAVFIPGLLLLPVGWLVAGGGAGALLAGAAGVAMIACLMTLTALVSVLIQLLFRDRRRAEIATLVATLLLSSMGMIALLIDSRTERVKVVGAEGAERPAEAGEREGATGSPDARGATGEGEGEGPGGGVSEDRVSEGRDDRRGDGEGDRASGGAAGQMNQAGDDREASRDASAGKGGRSRTPRFELPVWLRPLPSELYGRVLLRASSNDAIGAAVPLAGLLLLAGTGYGVFAWGNGRLLDAPATGPSRRGTGEVRLRHRLLPGLSPAVSAVALAQMRSALRTVKGKAGVFITPVALVLLGVGLFLAEADEIAQKIGSTGFVFLAGFGAVALCLLSLLSIQVNQFATDGPGLTLQFLAPLDDRQIVRGKVAGVGMMLLIMGMILLVPAAVLVSWEVRALIPTFLAAALSAFLLLSPLAAILSAAFPKPADLSRIGKAGNPHPVAAVLGTLLGGALVLPPAGLAAIGVFGAGSALLSFVLVAGWAAVSALLFLPLCALAARVLASRRENLGMIASES